MNTTQQNPKLFGLLFGIVNGTVALLWLLTNNGRLAALAFILGNTTGIISFYFASREWANRIYRRWNSPNRSYPTLVLVLFLAAYLIACSWALSIRVWTPASGDVMPRVLVIGDLGPRGFGKQVKDWITASPGAIPSGLRVNYLNLPEPELGSEAQLAEYRKELQEKLAHELGKNFPMAIISANSSTTVGFVTDLTKKMQIPTLIVAATKSGVVSYEDDIVRMLPSNLAQAWLLAELRRSIGLDSVNKWRTKLGNDIQAATWDKYVREVGASRGYGGAAGPPSIPPAQQPPKVLVGFVHDRSPFAKDLWNQYRSICGLEGPELSNCQTVPFECKSDSEIAQNLKLGRELHVAHWIVALYPQQAQAFYQAKGAIDPATPVTFCDSAYGSWLFGKMPKTTARITLPVCRIDALSDKPYPLRDEGGGAGTINLANSKFANTLHSQRNCYGPFAVDAITLVIQMWKMHQLDSRKGEMFSDTFYQTVIAPTANGNPPAFSLYHCRQFKPCPLPQAVDLGRSESKTAAELEFVKTCPFVFQTFEIGEREGRGPLEDADATEDLRPAP